jgi:hypothetical protein
VFFLSAKSLFSVLQIDQWLDFAKDCSKESDGEKWLAQLETLSSSLTLRTYFVGHRLSLADVALWQTIQASDVAKDILKKNSKQLPHLFVCIFFFIISFFLSFSRFCVYFRVTSEILVECQHIFVISDGIRMCLLCRRFRVSQEALWCRLPKRRTSHRKPAPRAALPRSTSAAPPCALAFRQSRPVTCTSVT